MALFARNLRTPVYYLIGWLLALGLMALCLWLFQNPIMPSPWAVLTRLIELGRGPLWYDLWVTSARSVLAFGLALFLGITWAAVFAAGQAKTKLALPALLLLQAAPVIIWIVPLVLLLGSGHAAPVIASLLVVLPVIALEFRAAFEMTSRERREFWRYFAPDKLRRLRLRLRYEWQPHLAATAGIGSLLSFKAAAIAEWFAAQDGIGRRMQQAFLIIDMPTFLALALVFLTSALLLSSAVQCLIRTKPLAPVPENTTDTANIFPSAPPAQTALVFDSVSFAYSKEPILQNATFNLKSGEITLLTGISGSGKSTFMKLAAGIMTPTAGKIIRPASGVGLVFQSDFLFPRASVAENAGFFLANKHSAPVGAVLKAVGLEPQLIASELSGGMRRRLALARCLLKNSPVMILDEPFNGLDEEAIKDMIRLLQKAATSGRAVLIITHDIARIWQDGMRCCKLWQRELAVVEPTA